MARISAVIPARNRAHTIAGCLDSILSQSRKVDEIVVCDDASSDDTCAVVEAYSLRESQVKIILARHEEPRGAQAARNTAIRASSGDIVAFNDSDDQWIEQKVGIQLAIMANTGAQVAHCGCVRLEQPANIYSLFVCDLDDMAGHCHNVVLSRPGPVFPGIMASRAILDEIGLLDEKVPSYQEWDTAIRLAKVAAFAYTPMPLFVYHTGAKDSISASARREALGYEYIVNKHKKEMLAFSTRALSRHYQLLAAKFARLGMADKSGYYKALAGALGK